MEEQILNSNHYIFSEIIKNLPFPLSIKRADTLRYVYCNEPFASYINKKVDDIIGKTVWEILDYDLASQFSVIDEVILKTKMHFNDIVYIKVTATEFETVNLLKFPLLDKETNDVKYIVVSYQILTKQFYFDETLRNTELLYIKIFEHFPLGILAIREKDLVVIEANSNFLKLKNFELNEIISKPLNELKICNDMENLLNLLKVAKETNSPQHLIDDFVLPSGKKVTTLIQVDYVSFLNVEPMYLLLFSDLTKLYEANEQIFTYLRKEEELKVLRNWFISLLGHEIQTPLTGILLSVELIQRLYDKLSPEEKKKHFDRIKNSIQSITKLIENSVQIEKLTQDKYILQPKNIPIKKYLQDMVEKFIIFFNYKNPVIINAQENLELSTDEVLFNLIINNLLNNAFKYSPFETPIYLDVHSEKDKVVFKIKNFGEPIAKEDLPHIFTPFFRGRNSSAERGHGLGLAIVKKAVDTLNGNILAESSMETGTIFTLVLPNLKDKIEKAIKSV